MSQLNTDTFVRELKNNSNSVLTLILGLVLLFLFFVQIDKWFQGYIEDKNVRAVIYILVLVSWIGWWLFNKFFIPRNNPKKLGILISIYADTREVEDAVKADFIDSFEKQIKNHSMARDFKVIILKNHQAKNYRTHNEIIKLHSRARCHFYMFGEVKKRKDGDGYKYFLELNGRVVHLKVDDLLHDELTSQFIQSLPQRSSFPEDEAFKKLIIAADMSAYSAEYMLGLAAHASGDPKLAIKLHESLHRKLSAPSSTQHTFIKGELNKQLAKEHALLASFYCRKEERELASQHLLSAKKFNAQDLMALTVESVIAFGWERNPYKALGLTKKALPQDDQVSRYNEAFLYFWLGDYANALKCCKKLKKYSQDEYDERLSNDCINFSLKLLKEEEKPVLFFWIAYNYYIRQSNASAALQYVEKFLEKRDTSMNILAGIAQTWLAEIKRTLQIL